MPGNGAGRGGLGVMPFQTKIQPMELKSAARGDAAKHAGRSRLKRLLERSVLRVSAVERLAGVGDGRDREKDDGKGEVLEPSSVCLDRMVLSFIEESNDKPPRSRCNCFNGNYDDSSDGEFDLHTGDTPPPPAAVEILKGMVPCPSVAERNLLADTWKILERSKNCKGKGDNRRVVADGLKALGCDAAVCKSRWEKGPSFPAGEHEYVDVVVGGDRFLVEVDFRSEFEIARSTKSYRAALQTLPSVYVGTADRLSLIVTVVADAARQSLKKKGLHFPPWRKPEYMRAKWLSPYQRVTPAAAAAKPDVGGSPCSISAMYFASEVELRFEEPQTALPKAAGEAAEEKFTVAVSPCRPPPEARPKAKLVTGLAAVL